MQVVLVAACVNNMIILGITFAAFVLHEGRLNEVCMRIVLTSSKKRQKRVNELVERQVFPDDAQILFSEGEYVTIEFPGDVSPGVYSVPVRCPNVEMEAFLWEYLENYSFPRDLLGWFSSWQLSIERKSDGTRHLRCVHRKSKYEFVFDVGPTTPAVEALECFMALSIWPGLLHLPIDDFLEVKGRSTPWQWEWLSGFSIGDLHLHLELFKEKNASLSEVLFLLRVPENKYHVNTFCAYNNVIEKVFGKQARVKGQIQQEFPVFVPRYEVPFIGMFWR